MATPSDPSSKRAPSRKSSRKSLQTSAGGFVLDNRGSAPKVALIGRRDGRGRLTWSLPKGHLEAGETSEQAAIREVFEETGITGSIVAGLGTITFWFMADGVRVHKTVHHYLLDAQGGELSDADAEVDVVAWVPLTEVADRLQYADERKLLDRVNAYLSGDE